MNWVGLWGSRPGCTSSMTVESCRRDARTTNGVFCVDWKGRDVSRPYRNRVDRLNSLPFTLYSLGLRRLEIKATSRRLAWVVAMISIRSRMAGGSSSSRLAFARAKTCSSQSR